MEYEDNGYRKPTAENVQFAIGFGWSKEQAEQGFDIFDYDGTGMLEVEAIGDCYPDEDWNNEACAREAERLGICKIIPVNELPINFEHRYYGWVDTPENRKAIDKYCGVGVAISDDGRFIYGRLSECVDRIWSRIDTKLKFPNFDFAADVPVGEPDLHRAIRQSKAWFTCRNVTEMFNGRPFSLVFGYYGRGVDTCIQLDIRYDKRQMLMQCISKTCDKNGYGTISPNDYVTIEFINDEEASK